MKLRNVGWVVPMMMGVAAVGTVFAFAASHSMAGEGRDDTRTTAPRAARCVSAPLETSRVIDRKTLYVEDRMGNAAVLTMSNSCLERGEAVGFEYFGVSDICHPNDVQITGSVMDAVPMRCMVARVELLDRDQAKEYRGR